MSAKAAEPKIGERVRVLDPSDGAVVGEGVLRYVDDTTVRMYEAKRPFGGLGTALFAAMIPANDTDAEHNFVRQRVHYECAPSETGTINAGVQSRETGQNDELRVAPAPSSQPAAEGTPRTDALLKDMVPEAEHWAITDLARTLERELAEAKRRADHAYPYPEAEDWTVEELAVAYAQGLKYQSEYARKIGVLDGMVAEQRSRAEAAESRLSAAVLAEREACAGICAAQHIAREKRLGIGGEYWDGYRSMAKDIAAAIRARTGVSNDR